MFMATCGALNLFEVGAGERRPAAGAAARPAQRPRLEQDQVTVLPDGEHPVNKQAPSAGKILTMVAFAASCVGLLLFLWISFGGTVPFAAQGYRMNVEFKDAVQLGAQSDVRISGVSVGKVVAVTLDRHTGLTQGGDPDRSQVRSAAGGHARDPAREVAARRDLRRADAGLQHGAQAARRRHAPARPGVGRRSSSIRSCRRSIRRPARRSRSGSSSTGSR